MKKIYKYFTLTLILIAMSCNMDRDLDNPNEATTDQANADLLMNKIELDFAAFYSLVSGNDISGVTGTNVGVNQVVRMMAMISGSTYERALISQNFDQMWTRAYQDVLINIETLLPIAEEKNLVIHAGASKVMKAYIYITLVDVFGDVPKTEALQGTSGQFNPKADPGSQIYSESLALLDEAIADLGSDGAGLDRDIYYNGDADKWITLANSLKLKAWMNISGDPARKAEAVAAITALLNGNLIDTDDEEFTYKYGTADIPARSRHPQYRQFYTPAAGNSTGYIGNYFLKEAFDGKGIEDPRWRYYFYRQVGAISTALAIDPESVPCVLNPKPGHFGTDNPFCVFDPGFFGRDHGDASGTPPDGAVKTCVGVYPAGGLADTNVNYSNAEDDDAAVGKGTDFENAVVQGMGGNGKGIEPIFMSFFVDFMRAEAALRLNIGSEEDAKNHMIEGITKSINRVKALGASLSQTVPEELVTPTLSYTIFVGNLYDGSADKLDVVMKEYYLALFGNGIEAYNLYRRTSSPRNIQPMLAQNGGSFAMSLIYPAVYANLNGSVTQKADGTVKVFWDKNTDDLK